MSKNIIEIALKAGFLNTSNGLESPFIEGEDLTDNLKLFASLLLAQPEPFIFKDRKLTGSLIAYDDMYKKGYAQAISEQTEQEPVAWLSISDIEWMNIVNSPKILELTDGRHNSEEAVNLAVKMTEEKCKKNNSDSIPKREPLSDEAVCEILLKKEWRGFVDLVRIIEKAHGIGVDDE